MGVVGTPYYMAPEQAYGGPVAEGEVEARTEEAFHVHGSIGAPGA
jgi:hypothetical protein